jgi:hypothetical protein
VLHGSYQEDLASRHAFADLAALRGLPPGDATDRREVTVHHPMQPALAAVCEILCTFT